MVSAPIHGQVGDHLEAVQATIVEFKTDAVAGALRAKRPQHGRTGGASKVGSAVADPTLLPAGLGVVDGTLILALSHSHLSTATATAGVVVYRLISVVTVFRS
jgi:hypothetical protein